MTRPIVASWLSAWPPPSSSSSSRVIFGARGRAWLDLLPERVEHHRREWQLVIEGFLPGGLMSCCLAVKAKNGRAAVLKLSGPWTPAGAEAVALRAWRGGPAPDLLRADEERGALLLERICPGDPFDGDASAGVVDRLALLLNALHAVPVLREPGCGVGFRRWLPLLRGKSIRRARRPRLALPLKPPSCGRVWNAREHALPRCCFRSRTGSRFFMATWRARTSCGATGAGWSRSTRCPASENPPMTLATGTRLASATDQGARDELAIQLSASLGLDPARVRTWAAVVALEP